MRIDRGRLQDPVTRLIEKTDPGRNEFTDERIAVLGKRSGDPSAAAMPHHNDDFHPQDVDGKFKRRRDTVQPAIGIIGGNKIGDISYDKHLSRRGIEDVGRFSPAVRTADQHDIGVLALTKLPVQAGLVSIDSRTEPTIPLNHVADRFHEKSPSWTARIAQIMQRFKWNPNIYDTYDPAFCSEGLIVWFFWWRKLSMSTRGEPASVSPASRKGPNRSEASKAAILEAARTEMAENGWRDFSVDSVARRASASKQTIYRWWPSIGAMCVDAALALIPDAPKGGRDPLERITALIIPLEAAARTGHGHAVLRVALLAAADDRDAGEAWRAWVGRDIRQPLRMLLAELATKRVIRRDFELDEIMEQLLGPVFHRLTVSRAPVKEGFSADQAMALLRTYAPQ